jgi:hypothetical protein
MALPKGMAKGKLSEPALIFDLDTDPLDIVEKMPQWIAEIIKKSETYQARITAPVSDGNGFVELEDGDGELPF